MTTAYTSLLGLALPVTGELQGTWGDVVNNSITSLLDNAVAGTTTLSTDADVTLTTTTGASNQARQAILLCSGARTGIKNITAPASSKAYIVINATTGGYAVVVRGAGPTTGVTVSNGEKCLIAWNGSDFVKVSSTVSNAGGSNTQVQYNSGGVLAGNSNFVFDGTTVSIGANITSGLGYLQLFGPDNNASIRALRYSNDTAPPYLILRKTRGATAGSTTAVSSGDQVGSIVFQGAEGTTYGNMAGVTAIADAAPTTGSTPGAIVLATTPTGSATSTERMRIDSSGNVGIGRAPTAGYRLDVAAATAEVLVESTTGTNRVDLNLQNTSGVFSIGIDNSAGGVYGTAYSRAIFSSGAYPVTFWTASTERMRIDSSGNVSIASGNLTFSGTGQRITGDFTNATVANRVIFQTSTANSTTGVSFIPSGTGSRSALAVFGGSDTANAALCTFEITTSQSAGFNSTKAGTGTTLPIVFSIDSSVQLQLNTNGTMSSADNAAAVGYKGTPLNEQSAAYTLVLTDQGKSIVHPASDNNARTFTIPANASVAFPIGTTITFINMINTVTISITSDTLYLAGSGSTGSRTLAAYGMATAVKMTSTTWIISGNGLT